MTVVDPEAEILQRCGIVQREGLAKGVGHRRPAEPSGQICHGRDCGGMAGDGGNGAKRGGKHESIHLDD
ncbi:MAG: hypothetical protein ACOH2H_13810 [Cypionkella sp.]